MSPMNLVEAVVTEASSILERNLSSADDYFDQGADSLDTIELLTRLQARLGYEVPAHFIYSAKSLSEFADLISEYAEKADPLAKTDIP